MAQVVVQDRTLACVESDRFCNRCGYNLRTLPIRRDDRTKILLVRCTECGQYQPANDLAAVTRPWLHRVSAFFLILWIVFLVAVYVHLGIAQGAVMYGTLDVLTGWVAADSFAHPARMPTIEGEKGTFYFFFSNRVRPFQPTVNKSRMAPFLLRPTCAKRSTQAIRITSSRPTKKPNNCRPSVERRYPSDEPRFPDWDADPAC